jgi:alkylglycerol monooxygenase
LGTFEAEDPKEPVIYGLVHPLHSYNTLYIHFHHFYTIFINFFKYKGFKNKLSVLAKGTGWEPAN